MKTFVWATEFMYLGYGKHSFEVEKTFVYCFPSAILMPLCQLLCHQVFLVQKKSIMNKNYILVLSNNTLRDFLNGIIAGIMA